MLRSDRALPLRAVAQAPIEFSLTASGEAAGAIRD